MPPRLKNFLEPDEIALYICCGHQGDTNFVTTTATVTAAANATADGNNNENNATEAWGLNNVGDDDAAEVAETDEEEVEEEEAWIFPPVAEGAATNTAAAQAPPLPPNQVLTQPQHVFRPSPSPAAPLTATPPTIQPLPSVAPTPHPAPPLALLPHPPAAPTAAQTNPPFFPDSLMVPSLENNNQTTMLDYSQSGPSFPSLWAASQHSLNNNNNPGEEQQEEEDHLEEPQEDEDHVEEEDIEEQEDDDEEDNNFLHRRILPSTAFDEGSSEEEDNADVDDGDSQHETTVGSESWNSATAAAVASAQVTPSVPTGVARIDVLGQGSSLRWHKTRASSSASFLRGHALPHLHADTTTYQDLQHWASRPGSQLPDLMSAIDQAQSPRLTSLAVRLLADHARHSVHLFFAASPPLLHYLLQRVLLNPAYQGNDYILDTAAQVLRSLSTHELMDPLLLAHNTHVLPTLACIAQGGGPVPVSSIGGSLQNNTQSTVSALDLDVANLSLPETPAPHSTPMFSFSDHNPSSSSATNRDAPLLAPRFSSTTASHFHSQTTTQPWLHPDPLAPTLPPPPPPPPPQSRSTRTSPAHSGVLVFSETARAHACICLMNLSCGPANKAVMARQCPPLLAALRTLLLDVTKPSLQLKAVTTLKNLSNLESNDTPLITFPGLVHALGQAILHSTLHSPTGATACTTHACMALMNLSISKAHKAAVYHTPGIMQSLLTVLDRTYHPNHNHTMAHEARVRACCVISNLAIGYDNKWSMFQYPGLVDSILNLMMTGVVEGEDGQPPSPNQQQEQQVRSKACSILWSLAAEKANQIPLVQTTRAVSVLISIAGERTPTDVRQKCVAALTLLAESPDNAVPLLRAGVLEPLFNILHQAGSDPTQWKDHTASWCVSCFMNLAQVDAAVPALVHAGVVSTLSPLVHMDQEYQSLKAAMAVTLTSRLDSCRMGQESQQGPSSSIDYALLRKMETVIPKMINLLFNTLAGRGGEGYRYGVFTLSSSVACLAALVKNGPEFVQERVCTTPVCVSLLQVVWDFCVDGGTDPTIVGGGRDDVISAKWAIQALHSIVLYLHASGDAPNVLPSLSDPMTRALNEAYPRFADRAGQAGDAEVRAMISHTLSLMEGPQTTPRTSAEAMQMDDDSRSGVQDDLNDSAKEENVDLVTSSPPLPPQKILSRSTSAPSTPTTGKRKQPEAPSAPSTAVSASRDVCGNTDDGFFSPVSVAIALPDFDGDVAPKTLRRRSSDPTAGDASSPLPRHPIRSASAPPPEDGK